jgi:hypothetical protein
MSLRILPGDPPGCSSTSGVMVNFAHGLGQNFYQCQKRSQVLLNLPVYIRILQLRASNLRARFLIVTPPHKLSAAVASRLPQQLITEPILDFGQDSHSTRPHIPLPWKCINTKHFRVEGIIFDALSWSPAKMTHRLLGALRQSTCREPMTCIHTRQYRMFGAQV